MYVIVCISERVCSAGAIPIILGWQETQDRHLGHEPQRINPISIWFHLLRICHKTNCTWSPNPWHHNKQTVFNKYMWP